MADITSATRPSIQALAEQAIERLDCARELVGWGASMFAQHGLFFGHGTDNPHDEAAVLVLSGLGYELDAAGEQLDATLTSRQKEVVVGLLVRRIVERKPAPYLTGEAWFAGLRFLVDERVLVPRSPIAEWIERGFSPWIDAARVHRILDIGTGSGCIAIAAALVFPEAEVVALDISEQALQVTRENIDRYGLRERVKPLRSDLFDAVSGCFDVIVSNPPYVDREELASMPAEFHHEPLGGLSGGEDGLTLVRKILSRAQDHMNDGAVLIVEVGASAPALLKTYPNLGFIWLDLERGGENVFLLDRAELAKV